jgi:transposase
MIQFIISLFYFYRNKRWLYEQYIILKKSTIQIAKEYGCSYSVILKWLKKFNIPTRNPTECQTIIQKPYMKKEWLFNQYITLNKSISQIAMEIDCGTATISRWLIKLEIPRRKSLTPGNNKKLHHSEYNRIHKLIRKLKPKPEICEKCKKEKKLELSNISGQYYEDINDYEWLCRKCHLISDKRIKSR